MKTYPQICPAGHHEHLQWPAGVMAWCESCRARVQFSPVPQPTEVSAAEQVDILTRIKRRFAEFAQTWDESRKGMKPVLEAKPENEKENLIFTRLRTAGFPERHIARLKKMDAAGMTNARKVDEILMGVPGPAAVLLWGDYGTGKSQVACAVAMLRAQRGQHNRCVSAVDLMRDLRDNMKSGVPEGVYLRKYHDCQCLILDDVHQTLDDTPDNAAWARGQIQSLIDVRYRSNAPRKTIIIANATGEDELKRRVGGHILSRIGEDGKVLRLNAKKYRE